MKLSCCLLLFFLLPAGVLTGRAEVVENFKIDTIGDTAYAPYCLDIIYESDNGVNTKPIAKRFAVLQKCLADSTSGQLIFARNPALNIDNPGIFSQIWYPNHQIIDDDPVRLILGDWELSAGDADAEPIIYGIGYRCDSAFAFKLYLTSDSIEYLYLARGRDGTGDNRWDPQTTLLALKDYDLDGHPEIFYYINSMREAGPRELFCIDGTSMTVKWSLPVAATLNRYQFFCLPDKTAPRVVFSSYNPKQGVSDSIFKDLYAYFTIVDGHGRVAFNKIMAWDYGSVFLCFDSSISRFYLTHETDFLPANTTDTIGSNIYHVSILATDGTRERTVDVPQRIKDAWLGSMPGRQSQCMFVRLQDGTMNIYDSSLTIIASGPGGRLTRPVGKLMLPGMHDSVQVHHDGIYDNNYRELLRFDRAISALEVVSENPDGSASVVALGGGNLIRLADIEKRGILNVFETAYMHNQHFVLMLLSGLLVGLILLLWHRRKIKASLELIRHQKQEIERTHGQLNAAFNALPDIIFEVDREGLINMFRSPIPDLLPHLPREYVDQKVADAFPSAVSKIIMQAIAIAGKDGRFSGPRFELETPRGRLWFELSIAAKGDLQMENCNFVVLARDITARVRTEQDLRLALSRERILINATNDIAVLVDKEGIISSINNAAAKTLGGTPDKMVGNCVYDYMHPHVAENRRKKMEEMLRQEEPLIYEEYFPHGAFLNSIHPIFNEEGEIAQVGVFARDISQLHNTLERLRESEERYRTLQDNVPVAVFRTGVDGRVISLNPATARMFGFDDIDELQNLSAEKAYVRPEMRDVLIRKLGHKGYISDFQLECYRRDKSKFWISLSARAIKGESGQIEYIDGVATDITEKKAAEEALRESEEKYRALVETTKTGFVIINGNGLVIDANDEYIRHTGRNSRADVVGHSVLEWTAEYDIERNRDAVSRCFKDGSIYNFEVDYVGSDAKITPIEVNATIVKTASGLQIHSLCRDISARKASEEHMRLLSLGIEQSSEGIAIANLDGKFSFVNRAFADMHGYESSELIGRHFSVLHNEDQLANVEQMGKQLLETGAYDGEIWHVRKNGECFPSLMHVSMMRAEEGNDLGVVVTVRDITALKKTEEALIKAHNELEMGAERALRSSEEKYRSVVENVPSDISVIDYEGNVLFANEAAARTHRRRTSEIVGRKIDEFFPKKLADYNLQCIRSVISTGQVYMEEQEAYVGGVWRWFDLNFQPFKDSEGQIVAALIIANDITERHRIEESRNALDREKYEQAKYIAGGIAHEINNSLAPALISLDKLTERLELAGDSDLERNRHLVQLSLAAVNRAINMTDLVTAYSRLEAEKQHDEINFNDLLREVIDEHADRLRSMKVGVDIDVRPELIFRCHREHAHSLFNNLIINSLDALTNVSTPKIFFNAHRDNGHLAIEVGDNGSGMEPEVRKRAFDVFFSTKHATGTGLGLAVVKRIVDLYDGKIDIRSELNSGTTFTILWPELDTSSQASDR